MMESQATPTSKPSLAAPVHAAPGLPELVEMMPCPGTHAAWQSYVSQHLPAFKDILAQIPITPGRGSVAVAEAFWLWRLVSDLRPSAIVESGSANGWSSFLLAAGAPTVPVLCFDPYRKPDALPTNAQHISADWTSRAVWPPRTLVFFDDHCNQRIRLAQARKAGVAHAVFHDVYPVLERSLVSLRFSDLIGLADSIYTFDPLWDTDPIFTDTTCNAQMYRWMSWARVAQPSRMSVRRGLVELRARRRLRNPFAAPAARRNWTQA